MIRTVSLLFAFVAVLGAIGYAQNMRGFEPLNYKHPTALAGQVNADGSVGQGSHFTVIHAGTGEYEVDFSEGYFNRGCPILTITGIDTLNMFHVHQQRCNVYKVYFLTSGGKSMDSAFDLIAVAAN